MHMHRKEERGKEEVKGREQKESQSKEKKLEIPVCWCADGCFLSVPKEESELTTLQKAPVAVAF